LLSVIASKAKQSQVFARNNRISTPIVAKIHGQFFFPLSCPKIALHKKV